MLSYIQPITCGKWQSGMFGQFGVRSRVSWVCPWCPWFPWVVSHAQACMISTAYIAYDRDGIVQSGSPRRTYDDHFNLPEASVPDCTTYPNSQRTPTSDLTYYIHVTEWYPSEQPCPYVPTNSRSSFSFFPFDFPRCRYTQRDREIVRHA